MVFKFKVGQNVEFHVGKGTFRGPIIECATVAAGTKKEPVEVNRYLVKYTAPSGEKQTWRNEDLLTSVK